MKLRVTVVLLTGLLLTADAAEGAWNVLDQHEKAGAIATREAAAGEATWLSVNFTLRSVDTSNGAVRLSIAGTTLVLDRLLLAKGAKVWIDDQEVRLTDLQPGTTVTLQLALETDQRRIVGVRASKGDPAGPAAAEIDRLIRQLGSTEFPKREAASQALEDMGNRAWEALTRAEASDDAEVRSRIRRLLQALVQKEGLWHCSLSHAAPPDPKRECSIETTNGKLYLVNEHGDRSEAMALLGRDQIEVTAIGWGNLKGMIEIDGEGIRIKWANGTRWTHKRR